MPQAVEVGEAATAFTREKLTEPFTVFTRMSGAPGRSRIERLYAFVQTSEGDLAEQLVRNGLARVHGVKIIPPGLANAKPELEKLQQLEDEAREEKIGGWGLNQGRLNVRLSKQTPLSFSVFVLPDKVPSRSTPAPVAGGAATPTPGVSIAKEIAPAKLDINAASPSELESIPGIGSALASRIIAARPFKRADDLRKVEGIGAIRYGRIRPYFQ
ncbi:MAG: helix-hairpin-helix domain-containing protein [Chthoniobacterales bacterium]